MIPSAARLIACGISASNAIRYTDGLTSVCLKFGISSREQVAGFVAQCAHESQNFSLLEERLSYSVERLMAVWPARFPQTAYAIPFARNPEKLANHVYAERNGNGDEASGDGWRYRGSGMLQLTGRRNFANASRDLLVDYVEDPDLVRSDPTHAAMTSGWYWFATGCNSLMTSAGIDSVSQKINKYDTEGLPKRRALYQRCLTAFS